MSKRRIALCGASNRGFNLYAREIIGDKEISAQNELIGVYDINPGRARYVAKECGGVPVYETFEQMVSTGRPDLIIIATRDDAHVEYCIKALELGIDVFNEKPMAIDANQVKALLDAEKRTGRRIKQCFNMRYYPSVKLVKQLISSGAIGDVYNVHFEFLLTANNKAGHSGHGASYYHRWNSCMQKSGGLLLSKATHHFDYVNWLVQSAPESVAAFGELRKYGEKNNPYKDNAERCRDCKYAKECEYYRDINCSELAAMYRDNEVYDSYYVDSCVYSKSIDIYDTLSLIVRYENGVIMSYSETSAGMYEGYKLNINGSRGRLEVQFFQDGGLAEGEDIDFIRLIDTDGNITKYKAPVPKAGSHDGADQAMLRVLLLGEAPEIPSMVANSTDGALSALIGVAGNISIREKRMVYIRELLG